MKKGGFLLGAILLVLLAVPVLYFVGKQLTGFSIGVAATPVSACGVLDVENAEYLLARDVDATGTCFTITANNITLDGQGFSVNHSTGSGSGSLGVNIVGANSTTVKNILLREMGSGSGRKGVRIVGGEYNVIFNTTVIVNRTSSHGMFLDSGSRYNNVTENVIEVYGTGADSDAIQFLSASYNTLRGNILSVLKTSGDSANSDGVHLVGSSSNNSFFDNQILLQSANSSAYRIASLGVRGNIIVNDSLHVEGNERSYGVLVLAGDNNTFVGVSIMTNVSDGHSVNITTSGSNLSFYDSLLNASHASAFDLSLSGGGRLVLVNTTTLNNKIQFDPTSSFSLSVFWYLDAFARYTNTSLASGANVSGWDVNFVPQFNEITGADGRIPRQVLLEYLQGGVGGSLKTFYSNYTFNATLDGENLSQSWNMTQSRDLFFTFTSPSSCPTLNMANIIYELTENVSSPRTCFTITADNVTVDCRGYTILYSLSGIGYGVYANRANGTRVKNCRITEGSNSFDSPALYFLDASGIYLWNNTLLTFGNRSEGILIDSTAGFSNANFNLISNNTIFTFGNRSHGIRLDGPLSFNNLTGNSINISTFGTVNGIYLNSDVDYSFFDKNDISIAGTSLENIRAFYVTPGSNFNKVSNIQITTSSGLTSGWGLQVQDSHNMFENTSIETGGSSASAIRVIGSNISFKNVYAKTSGGNARALSILGLSEFVLVDSVLEALDPGAPDLGISASVNGGVWNFTNVSFNKKSWPGGANGTLNIRWYLEAYTRYTNGTNASGTNVSAYDRNGELHFSQLTGANGRIPQQVLLEYAQKNNSGSSQSTLFSNYSFVASRSDSTAASQSWNISQSRDLLFLFTPLGAPDIFFVDPTPSHQSLSGKNIFINASIASEAPLERITYRFSGTDYSFYDTSLVLMMNFDNRSSLGEYDTLAVDIARGNNGVVTQNITNNGIAPRWVAGRYGGAFNLDGVDDFMNFSNPALLNQDFTQMSIAFWMYANSTTGSDAGLVGKGSSVYGTTYHSNEHVYFYISSAGGNFTSAPVSLNTWHFIVATYNGSDVLLYVDGAFANRKSGIVSSTGVGREFYLGRYTDQNVDSFFNGSIDEVRVWNRSLSAEEVRESYNANLYKYNQTQWYFGINHTNLSAGEVRYSVIAKTNSGIENFNEQIVTVVDPVLRIEALFPLNSSTLGNSSLDYTFNVSSLYSLSNCSVVIDGIVVQNTSTVGNGINVISFGTSEGSHQYFIRCEDTRGNVAVSQNVTFTISLPVQQTPPGDSPSSGPGGSPGGGGAPPGARTYILTEAQFTNGFRVYLARNDRVRFPFEGRNYTLLLASLRNTSAVFQLASQNFTLGLESKSINLNGDNSFDLFLTLERIVNGTAGIFLRKERTVIVAPEIEPEKEVEPTPEKNMSELPPQEPPSVTSKVRLIYRVLIGVLIALIFIIGTVLIALFFIRRKKNSLLSMPRKSFPEHG